MGQKRRSGWSRKAEVFAFALSVALFCGRSAAESPAKSRRHPEFLLVQGGELSPQEVNRLSLVLKRELAPGALAPAVAPVRWLDLNGKPVAAGSPVPAGGIRLQAYAPGEYLLPLKAAPHTIQALKIVAISEEGRELSRASPSRFLPRELDPEAKLVDPEGSQRVYIAGRSAALPSLVTIVSVSADGRYLDALRDVPLSSAACLSVEAEAGLACASTPRLRIATDLADRNHPSVKERSLLGEVGGTLRLRLGNTETFSLPIGAPEALEASGPGRYRVKLRARVVRTFAGGPPAVGATDDEAVQVVREEVESASRMWGQCGIHLGASAELDVEVIDPPQLSMLTIGCGRGLPASGGTVRLSAAHKNLFLRTRAGESPLSVASRLAAVARALGLRAELFRNARTSRSALGSLDLVLTDQRGRPAALVIPTGGASDDPTLSVCQIELDLADGLEHFDDFNAAAGTAEERYLLRALSDDDPSTIELIVVPAFGGLGRIGESFIHTRGGSMENALILDRTGLRAGTRSFTLAHELGHILLDLPGHPDDFGVDTPTSLMDADAADSTIFGPRRLSLSDCKRALKQSGRSAPVPMIVDWPLE